MKKSDIDSVYAKIKSLNNKVFSTTVYRGEIIEAFLSTLIILFKINGELESCKRAFKQQGISIWENSSKEAIHEKVLPIPLGFVSANEFVSKYKYPDPSTLTRALRFDSDMKSFFTKISKFIFLEPQKVHEYFLTPVSKQRYPGIHKSALRYEKERLNEHQREGKADSKDSVFL